MQAVSTHNVQPDAIELLIADHRAIEALFKAFEEARAELQLQGKLQIAVRACAAVTYHTMLEEEIFYPAVRSVFQSRDEVRLCEEALAEHGTVKGLVERLESMAGDDVAFDAVFHVMAEYFQHHMRAEESEMFPILRSTGLDFALLGHRMRIHLAAMAREVDPDSR